MWRLFLVISWEDPRNLVALFCDEKDIDNIQNGERVHKKKNHEPPLVSQLGRAPQGVAFPWEYPEHQKENYPDVLLYKCFHI